MFLIEFFMKETSELKLLDFLKTISVFFGKFSKVKLKYVLFVTRYASENPKFLLNKSW